MSTIRFTRHARGCASIALLLSLTQLQGCFPLFAGAVASTALVAMDRRHPGAQAVDRGIQLEADAQLSQMFGDDAHLNAAVFNRKVLLTGEARTEAIRARAEQYVRKLANVRDVINEIAIGPNSSLGARSQDTLITSAVKTALIATQDVPSDSIRVVTEAQTVYLMGLVTASEAALAANAAAGTSGVRKVVKVFDLITDTERDAIVSGSAKVRSDSAPMPNTTTPPAITSPAGAPSSPTTSAVPLPHNVTPSGVLK